MVYHYNPAQITRIERGDRVLLFYAEKPAWLVTNSYGEGVLALCDGQRTAREVAEEYGRRHGQELTAAAEAFIHHAAQTGIFDDGRQSAAPHRQQLSLVQLSISSHCNLHCTYCYATDRREHGQRKMDLDDYRRVVDSACSINPGVSFTLTGGEPLLNSLCLDIAHYIRSKGCSVDLLTNGWLITEENVEEIGRLFYKVTISADGSTPERFEKFRGKGTYERIHNAIALLEAHHIEHTISMVVNRQNLDDVEAMARRWGSRLNYQPLFHAGNAVNDEELGIAGEEYYDVLAKAHGVNPLSYCEQTLDASQEYKICKCAIADGEISISETGDVYPCQLLHYPELLAGNIFEDDVATIYQQSAVLRQMRGLTVDHIEGCRECFLRYVCGGACRARAYHEKGSLWTSGDFCEYERRAFVDGIFKIYSRNTMTDPPTTETEAEEHPQAANR